MLVEVARRRFPHAYRYQYARLVARPQVPVDPIDDPDGPTRDATGGEMAQMGIHLMGRDVDPENGTAFDTDGVTPIVRIGRYVSPGDSGEVVVREDDMAGKIERERVEPNLLAPPPGLELYVEPIAWGGARTRMKALSAERKMRILRAEVMRAVVGDTIRDRLRATLSDRVEDTRSRDEHGRKLPERRENVLLEARRLVQQASHADEDSPEVIRKRVGMQNVLDADIVAADLIMPEAPVWEDEE